MFVFEWINPTISRMVIEEQNVIYLKPKADCRGDAPHTSVYTSSRGTQAQEFDNLNGKAWCFPSWHDSQNIFSLFLSLTLHNCSTWYKTISDGWHNLRCQFSFKDLDLDSTIVADKALLELNCNYNENQQ